MATNPSFLYLFKRGFSLSIRNLYRNKFLSIATIFVIGTIIFIFNIILAVNFIAKDALTDIGHKIDMVVYMQDSTTLEDANTIMNEVMNFEGVEETNYTSKEEALSQIKTTYPNISTAFDKYKLGNPLPASINITTKDPSYHEAISRELQQAKYRKFLSNVSSNSDTEGDYILSNVSKNLVGLSKFTYQIIFWLIAIFVIGGVLIILNALHITIFNRKKEIQVMKLVGASHFFIRLPFIIESMIYGVLAVIFSFGMLMAISGKIQIQGKSIIDHFSSIEFYKIFIAEILATIVLCGLSAMLAVHEYLQKKSLHN